jgi:hypothetical protein
MGMIVTGNMKGPLIMGYDVCLRSGQCYLFLSVTKNQLKGIAHKICSQNLKI